MTASVVRIICPNLRCRSILAVPASVRGKMVRCRSCGARVQVPAGPTGQAKPGQSRPVKASAAEALPAEAAEQGQSAD